MSFLTIATWMQKEATNCPNLTEKCKKLAELIESHEQHLMQQQDNWEEDMSLRMAVFTAQLDVEQRAEELVEQQMAAEQARRVAEELTQLRTAFQMIDMDMWLENEEQAAQLRMLQRVQQIREEWERERPMYEQMDKRQIVQKLRGAQNKLATAQSDHAEAKACDVATANHARLCQMKLATMNRNQCIVNIIKNMQELKRMEAEIQQEKREFVKSKFPPSQVKHFALGQRSPTTPAVAVVTPQSPTAPMSRYPLTMPVQAAPMVSTCNFNSFNPLSFLRSLNANMPNMPNFSEHFSHWRTEKEANVPHTAQLNSSLRSILSVSKTSADTQTKAPTMNTKHVTFQLDSSMESWATSEGNKQENVTSNAFEMEGASVGVGEARFDSATKSLAETEKESEMETEEIIVVPSQSQTQIFDLNIPEAEVEFSTIQFEQFTDEEINVEENDEDEEDEDENSSNDKLVAEVKSSKVEVQECRIIKQAGTPLPKVLPTSLSPTQPSRSPPTSDDTFRRPEEPVTKKPKTVDSFFNDFLKSSAIDSDSSDGAGAAKRDDFAALFSNSLQSRNESEGDDDNDFNFNTPDLAMGSNSDEMFELDMDSPDEGGRKRSTQNYL